MEETKSTGPLNQEDGCTYELTGTVATYTKPAWTYIKLLAKKYYKYYSFCVIISGVCAVRK